VRAKEWISRSREETEVLAERMGLLCTGGEIFGLIGELGSGKTCFVHGLARGLEVPPGEWVRSPSFTLVHGYRGRIPLTHVDLYRLPEVWEGDFDLREFLDGKRVLAIEWFDKVPADQVPQALRVEFRHRIGGERKIRAVAESPRYIELLERLESLC
jgi:tRNA threonylcarbamoyladenosine biosynthesis protein TsaE